MSEIKIQKDDRIRSCQADDFEFFKAQGYSKVGAAPSKPKAKAKAKSEDSSED